jgi:hypothetical protein
MGLLRFCARGLSIAPRTGRKGEPRCSISYKLVVPECVETVNLVFPLRTRIPPSERSGLWN